MSWPDQLSTQPKCLLCIVYSILTQGSLAWLTSRWSDSSFFSPQQFVRDLVNFHKPRHELYHSTMRDSSFWERPESDKHRGRKKEEKNDRKMENMAGTSTRFIWGRDREPLEKRWHVKLGTQMGRGYTKGVVTSRHGISKPACFFSGVWKIKEEKSDYFTPHIPELSRAVSEDSAWEQFVQPLSPSIKDENCRPRSRFDVSSWRWKENFCSA